MAAVDYGADAVYIGGARFGARRAAGNSVEEIARAAEYAHRFGVRVHATLNTLLWDSELADAERQARELIAAGVDALIVQDMALRRMNLPVELHASTQVSVRTPAMARFLGEAGFARVILERALSLEEIRAVCAATEAEVECFVHGAICVGYSGRCFLSRSLSERSGNRGACSQPCRLPWDLTDGAGRAVLKSKHLLSVRDLDLSERLGDLLDAGVASFKIEGRLKDTNYIRNVVAAYRRAVARDPAANAASLRTQAAKSGDTIFVVGEVRVDGAERFVPASLMAELRREGLERLLAARMQLSRPHRILPENPAARYPSETVAAEENVTNRLAEAFYRDHGVKRIEPPLELAPSCAGARVMRSAYCIRREIGECLREHPRLRGELYIERGAHRYRLEFDCQQCEMNLICENK